MFLNCCNAEAIMQMMTRRNDFPKPIEIYGIVDIYGKSILSEEGVEWKRHRRIVAPAFSEKSNALVWKESLAQALSMMNFWSKLEGNGPANIIVKDTARETALMTLHVISGAGFGVKQIWDGESEDLLGEKVVPGFNTAKLSGNHKLAFKDAINTLVHGMIWVAIFPIWLLSKWKNITHLIL
jgi:cytochrome P450